MNGRSSCCVRKFLLASTILCAGLSGPVLAQQAAAPAEGWVATDENGVDLTNGRYYLDVVEGQIGSGDGALSLVRHYGHSGLQDNWSGTLDLWATGQTAVVSLGKISEKFTRSGSTWTSVKANGGTLTDIPEGWLYRSSSGVSIKYQKPSTMAYEDGNVRRQNIWHRSRRKLAECGPRLLLGFRRRAYGVASADVQWSVA